MLVGAHHSAVNVVDVPSEMPVGVSLLLDGRKEPLPDPGLTPPIKAARHRAPGAIPLWQITPGGAGAEEPENTVEYPTMVGSWTACFRLLRGQEG